MSVQRPDFTRGDEQSRLLLRVASGSGLQGEPYVTSGLVELAQRHGLVPLLASETRDTLVRAVFTREKTRRSVLEHHLPRLLAVLRDAEIKVVVLKGPAVALRYADPSRRPFSDLDLLVPRDQVETALDVLGDYHATVRVPPKRPKADKRDVLIEDRSGMLFNVDLHWDLFSYSQLRGSAIGATDAAWNEAVDVDSPFGPMWELPDSYRLTFLCAHAVLDHRFRLILFRDFWEMSRGEVDWAAVDQVAGRWGLRSTTYLALWIARAALGARIPEEFLDNLRPRSAAIRYLERALPKVDLVRFDGHRPHPVNLAAVILNDSRTSSLSLLLRAPTAFPRWRRRVSEEHELSRAPRILILVSTDRRRGAEVFSERLRDGLVASGWVVEAVSLKAYGEDPRAAVEPLIGIDEASGGRFDRRVFEALRNKIDVFGPDIVIANGGATLRYAVAAGLIRKTTIAYIGIGEPHYWLRSWYSRLLNRLMLRMADAVFAVSSATAVQLTELEPSLAGRITTMYTGVPGELFELSPSDAEGPLRVLMVGSLTHEKNPMLALRAVSEISDARLRMVGAGPLLIDLQEEARRRQMSDRVDFVGSVADVTPHLQWAHVLVLTSASEGLPGAILEAGASGVPAIAMDVGGVREAIEDGVTGFVTQPDGGSFFEALKALDSDRDLLSRMGREARRKMKEQFSLDDVVAAYSVALQDLLG
jgi:glycosyltransferase involved in cell wall biosynthesis